MKRLFLILLALPLIAQGQTCPQTLIHGQPFTASGFTGAGSKSRAVAPMLVDQGSAATGTLDPQWTGQIGGFVNQNVGFAPTGATIGAPHPYVPRILAGSTQSADYFGPQFQFTRPVGDYTLYAEGWYQDDPNWNFFSNDNETELWNYVVGGTYGYTYPFFSVTPLKWRPNDNSHGWGDEVINAGNTYNYAGHDPCCWPPVTGNSGGPTGTGSGIVDGSVLWNFANAGLPKTWTIGLVGPLIIIPDQNNHSDYWGTVAFHAGNGWHHQAVEMQLTENKPGNGRFVMVEDFNWANPAINYSGPTDANDTSPAPFNVRMLRFLGGLTRDCCSTQAANNYRYIADARIDITTGGVAANTHVARVYLGENCTGVNCGKMVYQVPDSWADNVVSFHVWKGNLDSGATVHVIIQPEHGTMFDTGVSGTIQ